MKTQVCKHISTFRLRRIGLLFASLLVASTFSTGATAQDDALASFPALGNSALESIRGQGIHQRIPSQALPLAVILWDETGSGDKKGQSHDKPRQSADVIVRNNIGKQP